jgi:hydrogenase expression/formation protein HypE
MDDDVILLGHGSGGRLSHQLLQELIVPALSAGGGGAGRDDAALLDRPSGRLAFTTDSFIVDPIFFPGGDIGDLAVNGTVNDLAMMGARPLWLSVGLILEEGLRRSDLARVLASMRRAADRASVRIVTGDTKVVPRGKADRLFVNTSGIGVLEHDLAIDGSRARPGDRILVSGTLGDHGVAVLASREGLALPAPVESDSAAVHPLTAALISGLGRAVHVLRDPTRGGVATTLKEIAQQSGVDLRLREAALPVRPAVRSACAILGLDPLHVANEGKLLAFVAGDAAERALALLRRHPLGAAAEIIGEVTGTGNGRIALETTAGAVRVVDMLSGEQLPRIC